MVERKYEIANSVSSISPCLSDHRSECSSSFLSSCNYKSSGSDLRYCFALNYSSSPLLYSFALQCCCNLVKRNGSHKSRSGLYRDFEDQSAHRSAPNTSVFSLQNAVFHYPYLGDS